MSALGRSPLPSSTLWARSLPTRQTHLGYGGSGVNIRNLTFNDYAALLQSGEAHDQDLYLARSALTHTPLAQAPALVQAEQQLGFTRPVTALNLWVGPSGHISCLHYDPMDGTLMQLQGSKHIILFPPNQLYNLYPFAVINHLRYGLRRRAVYSQVYPDRPDFESFPRFREALRHRQDVTLRPGEILFIPCGWWHEVSSVGSGAVLSINRWWNVCTLGAIAPHVEQMAGPFRVGDGCAPHAARGLAWADVGDP